MYNYSPEALQDSFIEFYSNNIVTRTIANNTETVRKQINKFDYVIKMQVT